MVLLHGLSESSRMRERMPMRERMTPTKLMSLNLTRRKMKERTITQAMVKLSSSWRGREGRLEGVVDAGTSLATQAAKNTSGHNPLD